MKRKRADRADRQRIIKKRFSVIQLATFTGAITRLRIDEVGEPVSITVHGKREGIADNHRISRLSAPS